MKSSREKVLVKKGDGANSDVITLQVASDDMGKVIGKQGRMFCTLLEHLHN